MTALNALTTSGKTDARTTGGLSPKPAIRSSRRPRQAHRSETSVQNEGSLGHPNPAPARTKGSRTRPVQCRDRQQAQGLRPGASQGRGHRRGRRSQSPCVDHSEEDGTPSSIRAHRADRTSVAALIQKQDLAGADFLFQSRLATSRRLSTRQYARLVQGWVKSIGLNPATYGTHSLRRTKAALIYRKTGNLRAVQLLLGHSKLESTV